MQVLPACSDRPRKSTDRNQADCEKGFLATDKSGYAFLYSPLVSEEEYRRGESKSLLRRIYDGSASSLVASLIEAEELSSDDLAALATILNGKQGGRE